MCSKPEIPMDSMAIGDEIFVRVADLSREMAVNTQIRTKNFDLVLTERGNYIEISDAIRFVRRRMADIRCRARVPYLSRVLQRLINVSQGLKDDPYEVLNQARKRRIQELETELKELKYGNL